MATVKTGAAEAAADGTDSGPVVKPAGADQAEAANEAAQAGVAGGKPTEAQTEKAPTSGDEQAPEPAPTGDAAAASGDGPDHDAVIAERDDLKAQVDALTKERDDLALKLDNASGPVGASSSGVLAGVDTAAHDAVVAERDQLKEKLEMVTAERDQLRDTAPASRVSRKGASKKARKLGAIDAPKRGDIAQAMAGTVEIVASDGKKEIISIEPFEITGIDAWQPWNGKFLLREAVTIKPPEAVTIAGFALIDDEGGQVGYCALPEPLEIAGGVETAFTRSIQF